jgi:hypothetical protein
MGAWCEVDVAVVDASDRRRADDQFPGVGIVAAIRVHRRHDQTRVVVVTGVMFDDAVRARMREAGADYYFHRSCVQGADQLCAAVLTPSEDDRVPPPAEAEVLHRLGVTSMARINAGIEAARAEGFVDTDPVLARRGRDRTRRRQRFNERARLSPMTRDGRRPDRTQDTPSMPQIQRFLDWATRMREPGTR